MKIKNKRILDVNVPTKLIFKNQIHEITKLDKKFVIKGYEIKTVDNKIDIVTLNNSHPNANPETGEFCIPHNLREHVINSQTLNFINVMLCCFNLDDCYFTPWNEIEYER